MKKLILLISLFLVTLTLHAQEKKTSEERWYINLSMVCNDTAYTKETVKVYVSVTSSYSISKTTAPIECVWFMDVTDNNQTLIVFFVPDSNIELALRRFEENPITRKLSDGALLLDAVVILNFGQFERRATVEKIKSDAQILLFSPATGTNPIKELFRYSNDEFKKSQRILLMPENNWLKDNIGGATEIEIKN